MLTTEKTKAMIAFGNEIKRLRVNLGLTQGELASEIKNCQTYISQLEKATSLASARMLDKLVDWFKDAGITIDEGIGCNTVYLNSIERGVYPLPTYLIEPIHKFFLTHDTEEFKMSDLRELAFKHNLNINQADVSPKVFKLLSEIAAHELTDDETEKLTATLKEILDKRALMDVNLSLINMIDKEMD